MKKYYIATTLLLMACLGLGHWLLMESVPAYREFVIEVLQKAWKPKLKIFVTYHKPYQLPIKSNFIVPIQVGRAVEHEPFQGGQLNDEDIKWLHDNMIGDDTGDNISSRNRSFDVLTAYYWVWKNYEKIGNPDYIGFFAHKKWLWPVGGKYDFIRRYMPANGLEKEELLSVLKKHPIVTWHWRYEMSANNGDKIFGNMYESYRDAHHIEDLKVMLETVLKLFPEMNGAMEETMYKSDYQPVWNFWIMKKELAFDYFDKLFKVMFEVEKVIDEDIEARDFRQRRAYGFLAERFFAIWVKYQMMTNQISVYYANVKYL